MSKRKKIAAIFFFLGLVLVILVPVAGYFGTLIDDAGDCVNRWYANGGWEGTGICSLAANLYIFAFTGLFFDHILKYSGVVFICFGIVVWFWEFIQLRKIIA